MAETPQNVVFSTKTTNIGEERLERLFNQLDVNRDGKIDVRDLSTALHQLGVPSDQSYAEKFIERSDVSQTGSVSLAEFINYVREHEKDLRLVFSKLDRNKDGHLDLGEIQRAFRDFGVHLDESEAQKLLKRMDRDGTLNISFDEWRDYLLFHPSSELSEIFKFWRHAPFLDIGEDINVPDDFTDAELRAGDWWKHLVAGGIAGSVSRTCTAPLDRLKVFLQVHGMSQYRSIGGCLQHLLREGGVKSMWRGNFINVLKIAPESAIKFGAYEKTKRMIRGKQKRELLMSERFLAGSIAGGVSQTVIYPLEVLKTRLALRKTGQYSGIIDAASKIYAIEGWKSFYRGYVPNLLGILPYAGIDLTIYETLRRAYIRRKQAEGGLVKNPPNLVVLLCGATSSTCGQIASYPLALVRTRLQAQAVLSGEDQSMKTCLKKVRPVGVPTYYYECTTMSSLFRSILQHEGPIGLYRGILPNFFKVAPSVSISYMVFESVRESLGVTMT